jgi:isoquinoline 1-oxidoreductase beta subunit
MTGANGTKNGSTLNLRFEVPVVETYLIKNAEAPGGIGEAPTAIVSAAVTNAIFAATGKRVRSLPIDTESLKSS